MINEWAGAIDYPSRSFQGSTTVAHDGTELFYTKDRGNPNGGIVTFSHGWV